MIIIWESVCAHPQNAQIFDTEKLLQAYPIKNIYNPHNNLGVLACEFILNSKYLVTLGAGVIY
jgi:hypothetical protein